MSESLAPTHLGLGLDARKERLINNAWRERAFEQLACIPVGFWNRLIGDKNLSF